MKSVALKRLNDSEHRMFAAVERGEFEENSDVPFGWHKLVRASAEAGDGLSIYQPLGASPGSRRPQKPGPIKVGRISD